MRSFLLWKGIVFVHRPPTLTPTPTQISTKYIQSTHDLWKYPEKEMEIAILAKIRPNIQ